MTLFPTFSRSVRVARFLKAGLIVVTVAASAAFVTGCGTDSAPAGLTAGATGRVRFVDLITDTTRGRVNAILEAVPFGVNLTYGVSTPITLPSPATAFYSPILTGSRTLVLKRTIDTTSTVATFPFTVVAGQDKTIFATGGVAASAVVASVTVDTNPVPTAGLVRVRIVNQSPTGGAIDVFVTAVAADLTVATPTAAALALGGSSAYVSVAAGTYQVRAVPAGTAPASRPAAVNINLASVALTGASARTFVAADNNVGGAPLRFVALTDR